MKGKSQVLFWLSMVFIAGAMAQKMPPSLRESAAEPVKYIGQEQPDKHFHHGGLRYAVGTHSYQVFRANRTKSPDGSSVGHTYNHAPMLCYWNDRFYLQFLDNMKEEHNPPGRTLITTSADGRKWSTPQVIFPVYILPEIKYKDFYVPEGMPAVMHQRMGFYVAPNGRLLTIGFYSYCPDPRTGPNLGQGLGHVVREIYRDGSYGPIYFIRYNRHAGWNEKNTKYPFYKTSADKGFISACEALLADKLVTLQWWEMDRAKDGFYTIDPGDQEIKALSYYHRPDGVVVGIWKHQLSALSADEGKSWTPLALSKSLMTCGAKVWGQRTEDGRYALVYNHSATRRNRFPLVIITGEDGHLFDDMLVVHGEVPPMRFQGIHKNYGPQYIRGIVEGNGDPPGNDLWLTFSINKEDIWVSRVRVPVSGVVEDAVAENFENLTDISELRLWNLYVPQWAPVSLANDPFARHNTCLEMRDEEPYDYALVQRMFPESQRVDVEFRILQLQVGAAKLEFEVQDRYGRRPLRLRFDPEWLSFDQGPIEPQPLPCDVGRWHHIRLLLDCTTQSYDVYYDGVKVRERIKFAEKVESLERLHFRTGPYRSDVRLFILDGEPGTAGLYQEDLPGADDKVSLSVFLIDDVKTIHY